MNLFTIGFTKKTAAHFFGALEINKVKELIDIRVHANSQLAGFCKSDNLGFFTKKILGIPYKHILDFAPPEDLMVRLRSGKVCFNDYAKEFIEALEQRKVLERFDVQDFDGACFMCTEEEPDRCHRRLLVEYFRDNCNEKVDLIHLL